MVGSASRVAVAAIACLHLAIGVRLVTPGLASLNKLINWLGNDNVLTDPAKEQDKLLTHSPGILGEQERVEMAFKVGKHKTYFTNVRVIRRHKKTWSSTDATFLSIPYSSIMTYSITTAGDFPDMDTSIKLYTSLPGLKKVKIDFRKGMKPDRANIFDVGGFFASKILGLEVAPPSGVPLSWLKEADKKDRLRGIGDFLAWLGSNATEIMPEEAAAPLSGRGFLGVGEEVQMAFRFQRDYTIVTSDRLIRVDAKDRKGKKIEFVTIPYKAIQGFVCETAGRLDLHSNLQIWTDVPGLPHIEQDLRRNSDVAKLMGLLSDKVLGRDPLGPTFSAEKTSLLKRLSEVRPVTDMFNWLTGKFVKLNPLDVEKNLRNKGLLQEVGEEKVLTAFKCSRDLLVLTNKRFITLDTRRVSKRVKYLTLPYRSIRSYAVRTPRYFDDNSELHLWTSMAPHPRERVKADAHRCPVLQQGRDFMPCIKFNLGRRKSMVMGIQKLLSFHVLGHDRELAVKSNFSLDVLQEEEPNSTSDSELVATGEMTTVNPLTSIVDYFSGTLQQMVPSETEERLRKADILQEDEEVRLAFAVGRDFHVWTPKRFLEVKFMGLVTEQIYIKSIPHSSIKAFRIITPGGMFDRDAEFVFWTNMPWMRDYREDLSKTGVNVEEVLSVLGDVLYRGGAGPSALVQQEGWVLGTEIDEADADLTFHNKNILPAGEKVEFAAMDGRDTTMLTNKRILREDYAATSSRITYSSFPYRSVSAFEVHFTGTLSVSAWMRVFFEAFEKQSFKQSFVNGGADMVKVWNILTQKLIKAFPKIE